jgi:lambda repressor-like predicted transcriptional regulator
MLSLETLPDLNQQTVFDVETVYLRPFTSHPGHTVLDLMEELGETVHSFAERTGMPVTALANVLCGGRPCDTFKDAMEKAHGTPPTFWERRYNRYQDRLAKESP